ncbi:Transcription initiation factor TFIID subunit 5 [Trichinella patagoniensis]|uniref:Transcription initiation factor TFIID subunit 5 n=1 Tax=Trichinella patagoniensis TaxID=990121 RepID=A0A0V0ZPA4_9BILA|nr:Transcription initiation factor TFIID subunit 5 [Trichinella patagoniensis]
MPSYMELELIAIVGEQAGQPLTNDDFRKLLMTPRPVSQSSLRQAQLMGRAKVASRSQKDEKKKKLINIIKTQDGPIRGSSHEKNELNEILKHYRDRAKERRECELKEYQQEIDMLATSGYRAVAPTLKAAVDMTARRKQIIEESKYLGGDMEHTHLVKGLDYALLQKVRSEISTREKLTPSVEKTTTAYTVEDSLTPEVESSIKSSTVKNIYQLLFKKEAKKVNEMFIPYRMAYIVELDEENAESDIPTTLIRSKHECASQEVVSAASIDDMIIQKLGKVLSYLRADNRKKKKEKGKGKEDESVANQDLKKLHFIVFSIVFNVVIYFDFALEKTFFDCSIVISSIYEDIGEYVPALSRQPKVKSEAEEHGKKLHGDYDRNSKLEHEGSRLKVIHKEENNDSAKSWHVSNDEQLHKHSSGRYFSDVSDAKDQEVKAMSRKSDRRKGTAQTTATNFVEPKSVKPDALKLDTGSSVDSYAECYPSSMAFYDAAGDSDDEADYSKMDLGNKKGLVRRWDFDTEQEYEEYMSRREALPRQYGVKMNDGRRTRKLPGTRSEKDDKAKINRQWQQITQILSKRKEFSDYFAVLLRNALFVAHVTVFLYKGTNVRTANGTIDLQNIADVDDQMIVKCLNFFRVEGFFDAERTFVRELRNIGRSAAVDAYLQRVGCTVNDNQLATVKSWNHWIEEYDYFFQYTKSKVDALCELSLLNFPLFTQLYIQLLKAGKMKLASRFYDEFHSVQKESMQEYTKQLGWIHSSEQLADDWLIQILEEHNFVLCLCLACKSALNELMEKLPTIKDIIESKIQIECHGEVCRSEKQVEQISGYLLGEAPRQLNQIPVLASCFDHGGNDVPSWDRIPFPISREEVILTNSDEIKKICLNDARPSVCFYTVLNPRVAVSSMVVSSDSTLLCVGNLDCSVEVFSLSKDLMEMLKPASQLPHTEDDLDPSSIFDSSSAQSKFSLFGHSSPVYGVSFNRSGEFVLSCCLNGEIILWNLLTRTRIADYRMQMLKGLDVKFGPYDGYFVVSDYHSGGALMWSMECETPVRAFIGHLSTVNCVAFHPNSNYVATGSNDRTVRLWDLLDGKCVRLFTGHQDAIQSLYFSDDGHILASGGLSGQVMLWDVAMAARLEGFKHSDRGVSGLAISRDGSTVAWGGADQKVMLRSIGDNSKSEMPCVLTYRTKSAPVQHLHFTQENELIGFGGFCRD